MDDNKYGYPYGGSPFAPRGSGGYPQEMLLLKACSIEDREAVVVPLLSAEQFEVSGPSLLRRIRKLTGWLDNRPRQVQGFAIPEHHAIAFDLHGAVPVQLKPSGGNPPGRHA